MTVNENKIVYIKKRKQLGTNDLVSPAAARVTGQTEANTAVIDAASRPQFPFKKHAFLEAPERFRVLECDSSPRSPSSPDVNSDAG